MVDARIPGVHPVAVASRIDEERRNGAVRFLLCRNSGQPNDNVRFFHHGFEHGGRVVGFGGVALKKLARRHHDLVGCLAATTAPAHAVRHNPQHAAVVTAVSDQGHLILLVLPVSFVDTGGGDKTERFGHSEDCGACGSAAGRFEVLSRLLSARLWHFRHFDVHRTLVKSTASSVCSNISSQIHWLAPFRQRTWCTGTSA